MWAYESTFYQIYPLGFCGAPFENDGILEHRILKVNEWIPHIKKLGMMQYISRLYLNQILTATTQETIQRLTVVSVQMTTSAR